MTQITIVLQVADEPETTYRVGDWQSYDVKLKEIRLAMKASGKEYCVFLIRKSKGNRIKTTGLEHKKYKKRIKAYEKI